jgi:hypothetical protein
MRIVSDLGIVVRRGNHPGREVVLGAMSTTLTRSMLAVLLTLGTWGTTALGSSSPEANPTGDPVDPVYVDTVDILYLESYPVQVHLVVTGSLPTPCHEPAWEVQNLGDAIDVQLWSLADADRLCITVLEPFELSIPLGSFETADMPVLLNGEVVGRVEVGTGEPSADTSLTGAGWSFGMCLGYCSADLEIDGGVATLAGRDRELEDPLFVNTGTLTAEAQEAIALAMAGLDGVALEEVYGCPDCADGGAAYLTLVRDGATSRHDMEYGSPPQELEGVHELAMSIIDALETCRSDALVTITGECQPQLR